MKATNNVKTVNRTITTTLAIILTTASVSAQGKLVEAAQKIFTRNDVIENEFSAVNASIIESAEKKSKLNLKDFFFNRDQASSSSAEVLESFRTKSIAISYEEDLATESWMTESLSENLEPSLETENWMTEELSNNVESAIEVESWMTEELAENLEPSLDTENWMSEPIVASTAASGRETALSVEPWMLNVFNTEIASVEDALEVESWMSEPLTVENAEENLTVEHWMVKPLYN